jgi:hypothetical protein
MRWATNEPQTRGAGLSIVSRWYGSGGGASIRGPDPPPKRERRPAGTAAAHLENSGSNANNGTSSSLAGRAQEPIGGGSPRGPQLAPRLLRASAFAGFGGPLPRTKWGGDDPLTSS